VLLGCGQVSVRDCGSTNGTFVDGTPVKESILLPGQTLRVGDVELLVADTEIPISIPEFEAPTPAPPELLLNGATVCRRHRFSLTTYRCTHCSELLCQECLHRLRRRGGKLLCLCPLCSYPVEAIGGEKKKKKSLLNRLRETTKLLFTRKREEN
jgi:pSer/pThr/pTyr-binding forkhead associated (FHA) protein